MNGKKCNYFNFDNAVTILKNNKNIVNTLISSQIINSVSPIVKDYYFEYDALEIGRLTSST